MNDTCDWCVRALIWLAPRVGMTYKEINVWLFVLLQSALIMLFCGLWPRARRRPRTVEAARSNSLRG